ncbi:glycoside hydrolase family 5 protein [Polycyclovorans algicola]|uniref:glycoside hydrolase family 5 protein n=1 Tax=Polycyclovorans algicola TaxID=616992 RepID=UPI001376E768|nr:cellulase family glycosylhydrolase [Polycyclovorans algicola]
MPRPRFDFFARLRMIGLAGLLLALSACSQIKGVAAPDPTLMQALARGVNLSHWFTHRTAFAAPSDQAIIGAADLTLIRQLGLDHVRIGVDPVWFSTSAGAADELMRGLEAVRDAGLAVVLAVQPEADYKRALIADPAAREDLLRTWAQLATPLAQWPPSKLAFEALNEPEHNDPVAVHQLMTDIVATLRDVAPRHTVIVSPGGYADVDDLVAFTPLEADNLIYTFHFYEPKNFTHQGAYWGWPMWISFSGFPYPSSPAAVAPRLAQVADDVKPHLTHYGEARWNRARLATQLDRAAQWATRHKVTVWCGEFGAYRPNAEAAHRHAWLNDVTELMHARSIGWSLWDYAGPFGLTEGSPRARRVDHDMAKAMGLMADAD